MASEVVSETERLSLEKFRVEIEKQLSELSNEQKVMFARRCTLYALPYLCAKGDMKFWKEEERLYHVYTIFSALDYFFAHLMLVRDIDVDIVNTARTQVSEAGYRARASFSAYATYAARDAICALKNIDYIVYCARDASEAAYNFDQTDLQLLLLNELQTIANNQPLAKAQIDAILINNFVKALNQENCHYWAKLYKNIFENNFEVDAEELKQRLNVPKEIKAQGAAAVGHYMEQLLAQGSKQLNESRILILGDKGAGKTCLARRLENPNAPMTTTQESTAGVDTSIWVLDKTDNQEPTNVRIWDFAGHTVTHAVHQFFLSERCLYILVFDGRTDNASSLEYWLDHMKNYGGDSQAIIVVNVKDGHRAQVPINKLKEKYVIHSMTYVDIDNSDEMAQFSAQVADIIANNLCWAKQHLPEGYYKVKEALEDLFDKAEANTEEYNENDRFNELIDISELESMAELYDIPNVEQLLKDLTALGIGLWYPRLGNFGNVVLNPEWISHGVYKMINYLANRTSNSSAKGFSIGLSEFSQVFCSDIDKQRFGEQHEFLFRLIEHYELAYCSKNDKQNAEHTLIFPHLMNEDQPGADVMPTFEVGKSLMLEYRAGQPLPPDTISRFIIRHNAQIKREDLVWRTGVVLADSNYPDTIALVKEDDRTISIAVKGGNKSGFIAQLRDTMNYIFASYRSDKPELLYEVIPHGELGQVLQLNKSLMIEEQKLLNYVRRDKPYYEDETAQDIDLKLTADTYNINTQAGQVNLGCEINFDNSTTINYQDCNFELQSNLNDLTHELESAGAQEQAKQLESAVTALEKAENCQTEIEVKKSGVGNRMKRLLEDMGDKNSSMHKIIEGTKNGVGIAQDLAEKYNDIAQWAGLPQVPKPFLKK